MRRRAVLDGADYHPEPVSFSWEVEILEKRLDAIQRLADAPDFAAAAASLRHPG